MNRYLFFLFLGLTYMNLNAQNGVQLRIAHHLHEHPFAMNQSSFSPEGTPIDVTRMEYYISEIAIEDYAGNITMHDSIWTLVDASQSTIIELDSVNVDSIKYVTFGIGVDSAHNHLDPSIWPSEHPLAHKNPSMHWGWANGYRFAAMEGNAGEELAFPYELHGLGDENYYFVTIEKRTVAENGLIDIEVFANYAEILHGMDLSAGVISHGPIYEAQQSIENMRDYVFSATVPDSFEMPKDPASVYDLNGVNQAAFLYPNPSPDGHFQLDRSELSGRIIIEVFDIKGLSLSTHVLDPSDHSVDMKSLDSGLYLIRMSSFDNPDNVSFQRVTKL